MAMDRRMMMAALLLLVLAMAEAAAAPDGRGRGLRGPAGSMASSSSGATTEMAGEGRRDRKANKCRQEDLKIRQWQVSRGQHPRWKMEVSSSCEACEASIVEVRCPGWVEGKAIEGYMYPVELVSPDLCMLGGSITASQPFSTVYRQPAGKIHFSVASVRFTCPP